MEKKTAARSFKNGSKKDPENRRRNRHEAGVQLRKTERDAQVDSCPFKLHFLLIMLCYRIFFK